MVSKCKKRYVSKTTGEEIRYPRDSETYYAHKSVKLGDRVTSIYLGKITERKREED